MAHVATKARRASCRAVEKIPTIVFLLILVFCTTSPSMTVMDMTGTTGDPDNPRRQTMLKSLTKLWKDEEGATAVEYGLIVAAIAAVVAITFIMIGNKANNTLVNVAAKLP
jgi:pilus assembly protein Flp/PilA